MFVMICSDEGDAGWWCWTCWRCWLVMLEMPAATFSCCPAGLQVLGTEVSVKGSEAQMDCLHCFDV